MAKKLTVEQVKEIAMKKYNRGGDQIIECWEDKEIEEWLKEGHGRADLNRMIKNSYSHRLEIEATAW